jgi:hypothetical protein
MTREVILIRKLFFWKILCRCPFQTIYNVLTRKSVWTVCSIRDPFISLGGLCKSVKTLIQKRFLPGIIFIMWHTPYTGKNSEILLYELRDIPMAPTNYVDYSCFIRGVRSTLFCFIKTAYIWQNTTVIHRWLATLRFILMTLIGANVLSRRIKSHLVPVEIKDLWLKAWSCLTYSLIQWATVRTQDGVIMAPLQRWAWPNSMDAFNNHKKGNSWSVVRYTLRVSVTLRLYARVVWNLTIRWKVKGFNYVMYCDMLRSWSAVVRCNSGVQRKIGLNKTAM